MAAEDFEEVMMDNFPRTVTDRPGRGRFAFRRSLAELFGADAQRKLSPSLIDRLHQLWCAGRDVGERKACEICASTEGVHDENSRTMYSWDGEGEDPNAPVALCRNCAEEHHRHWDDMWNEYNSTR